MAERLERTQTAGTQLIGRVIVYGLLIAFALYYLMPLFVMITTSVKTLAEIRTGNLLALPSTITIEPWLKAWERLHRRGLYRTEG